MQRGQLAETPWLRKYRFARDSQAPSETHRGFKAKCVGRSFLAQGHEAGMGVEKNCKTVAWMALRTGAEPVPPCPVYPPAPSWLQRKSLCCSETNSSDPDCFPSRGLKSVGKQT